MFIAFRVASQEEVRGKPEELKLRRADGGWAGTFNGREFVIQNGTCPATIATAQAPDAATAQATSLIGVALRETTDPAATPRVEKPSQTAPPASTETEPFPLRVPVADGKGGLFEMAAVRLSRKQSDSDSAGAALCASTDGPIRASVALVGKRLQAFRNPKAPRW
jgi:hypothetical protein